MDVAFAHLQDVLTDLQGDRDALAWRDKRWSWSEMTARTNRFAGVLAAHDIGLNADPETVPGWQSPHDHVALYLRNGNEYLEAMLGAWRNRAVATNVNYRYVDDELAYVLADQGAKAVVYHGSFAETLGRVLDRIERPRLLLRVDDGAGDDLLEGALDYEAALAVSEATAPPRSDWSPADRYVLYTGGTTGYPKGVMWRQDDFMVRALGLSRRDGTPFASLDEVCDRAIAIKGLRTMPLPPFMHGAAHWNALSSWLSGGTVVIQDTVDRFDAAGALADCDRHGATSMVIVGDAFARPIIEALREGAKPPDSLRHLISSGAVLSRPLAHELAERLGGVRIVDLLGSSETGRQGRSDSTATVGARFRRDRDSVVLSEARDLVLEPGSPEIGWLATRGRVPMGYLGDPDKTNATFPTIDGRRHAIAGDRARIAADGTIELHGRDSVTINSGGEKIFAEEVERAIKEHPAVSDVLVVGRPSERWGSEVVAVVTLGAGAVANAEDLVQVAARHIARYKLPKAIVFVDQVPRSPTGKPDYAAARALT